MEPDRQDDFGSEGRRRLEEAQAMAREQYQETKADVQASDAYKGWKSWTPAQRFFTVGLLIIGLIILVALVWHFAGVPTIPGPRGEG